jgi:hypothetical protein
MSVAPPPVKRCCVCGTDVAGRKRTKDPRGNYYCQPCWDHKAARESHAAQPGLEGDLDSLIALAEPVFGSPPAAASAEPLITCAVCHGVFSSQHVQQSRGRTVCNDCLSAGAAAAKSWLPRLSGQGTAGRSETRKERCHRLGSRYRIGGVLLQTAPVLWLVLGIWGVMPDPETSSAGQLMMVLSGVLFAAGLILMFLGFAYYAMEKGRSPAWCAAGCLGFLGLFILWGLADYDPPPRRPARYAY